MGQVVWSIVGEVLHPRSLGGLGILDLERFSCALRLRWIWAEWMHPTKPWGGSPAPCDKLAQEFFFTCSSVHVRDGKTARFWHNDWLFGEAPKTLAPGIFNLVWPKNRSVFEELHDGLWIPSVQRKITSPALLDEFIVLWSRLANFQLQPGSRTLSLGSSLRMAYTLPVRLTTSSSSEPLMPTIPLLFGRRKWRTLVQKKILTSDNLALRGWSIQSLCPLCHLYAETCTHLCLSCSYAWEVWSSVMGAPGFDLSLLVQPNESTTLHAWWKAASDRASKERRREFNGIAIYIMWNI